MRNLFLFFAKYGNFMLFMALEFLCFYFIINYNQSQKSIFLNSSNLLVGRINKERNSLRAFVGLKDQNEKLLIENAKLIKQLLYYTGYGNQNVIDSSYKFEIIPAIVINQTLKLRHNYITLDKGTDNGVKKGMGIITPNGIVGIIKSVSPHYAKAIYLLNGNIRISAKVKSKEYFGSLIWDSKDYRKMLLSDLPRHADIGIGDTIVTSGFSTVFPPNLDIGLIEDFNVETGSSNYVITVHLMEDLSQIRHVFIIESFAAEELKTLE